MLPIIVMDEPEKNFLFEDGVSIKILGRSLLLVRLHAAYKKPTTTKKSLSTLTKKPQNNLL